MNSDNSGGLFDCRPILCVESVLRSIDYYVNALGFHLGWAWANNPDRFLQSHDDGEPTFALVGRGPVQFMLSKQCQGSPGVWLHLDVHSADDLDALHDEWTRRQARIVEPPIIRPWGMYEMRVEDPDGHVLRVSAPPRDGG